ncbi:hypothetical protein O9992_14540 [Vibrio lentus]|nr:hypothetical protein [Vibrio lentus]
MRLCPDQHLGIDFENKGERVCRLLDCTLTFLGDLPRGGVRCVTISQSTKLCS